MSDEVTYPGFYKLRSAFVLPSQNSGSDRPAVDISAMVPKFTISQSINQDSIRGFLEVIDYTGFLEQYPLRGEEIINLTVEDALGFEKEFTFFLYRVDNVRVTGINDGLTYRIHFVSRQRFESDKTKIIKAYRDRISDIARDIFAEHYTLERQSRPSDFNGRPGESVVDQASKELIIEDTDGILRVIIPNFTPTRAMKFLETRAYSETSPSSSFRFFETSNAFYFVSDEFLFKEAIEKDKIFDFTNLDGIPNTPQYFPNHMNNFFEMENTDRFDTFDDLHQGAYHVRVNVLDIVKREANLKEEPVKYVNKRNEYFSATDDQRVVDRHTDEFIEETFTNETAKQYLIIKDYDDVPGQIRGEQYFKEIVPNRLMYRKHLNSIVLRTKGHGRLDVACGDIVNLQITEFNSEDNQPEENKQLSGKYLIEEVVHYFDKDVSENHYKLLKKDWSEVIDERVESFQRGESRGL